RTSGEKRVFLVILFTSFSGSLVSRIPGAVHSVKELIKMEQWQLSVLSAHPALSPQVIIQRQRQKRLLPGDAAKHALRSARA
ncbi:hypothetical protein, partial [Escherichia albertii]|uniref:hypothetical protein n=1 Tax=Escherichia albertii TaxID=208962 RepID=UPI001ED9C6A4